MMMSQSSIGTILTTMCMSHLKTSILNLKAPLKKLSPKEIKIKNKPWLNAEILKMIKRTKYFTEKKGHRITKTVNVYTTS